MAMEDATLVKRAHNHFILRAKADGEEYSLNGEMLVGREEDCAISINSGHISRYHAKINVSPNGGVYIEDLHSTNGTFVNGSKIKGRVKLAIGDEVGFDDIYFKLASSGERANAETSLSPRRFEQTEAPPRTTVPPTPIRPSTPVKPSAAPADPARMNASATKQDPRPAVHAFFPKADDIDLDKPLLSRNAIADEPDFEKHLEQRFHELDALMDEAPAAQARPSAAVAPAGSELKRQATIAPRPISKQARATENESISAAAKQRVAVARTEDAIAEEKTNSGEEDRTQILSSAQLDQFIERHRFDHELNVGSGPRLIVTTAPLRGKLFDLQEFATGSSVQLGRDANAEIYLNDKTISTDHARISKTEDGYVIRVTHAKNGMLVNGVKQSRVALSHNDKIQIGRSELVFKTDTGKQESLQRQTKDPLVNNGHGRRYSMFITLIALIVLVGAIVATSR